MTRTLFLLTLITFAVPVQAGDLVAVPGSSARFPQSITIPVNGKPTTMILTGAGLRTRFLFSVYAIGSYVAEGSKPRSAEELAKLDSAKVLYMVMERDVSGRDFIDALRSAIAKSETTEAFAAEFAQLSAALGRNAAKKGDHVILTAAPTGELRIQVVNKVDLTIKNPAFTQAIWAIYLGAKPIDSDLKTALSSRLGS